MVPIDVRNFSSGEDFTLPSRAKRDLCRLYVNVVAQHRPSHRVQEESIKGRHKDENSHEIEVSSYPIPDEYDIAHESPWEESQERISSWVRDSQLVRRHRSHNLARWPIWLVVSPAAMPCRFDHEYRRILCAVKWGTRFAMKVRAWFRTHPTGTRCLPT